MDNPGDKHVNPATTDEVARKPAGPRRPQPQEVIYLPDLSGR